MRKSEITPAVAARLVAAQFPQWSDLPIVPVRLDGWDNTTFRLGAELSVRLPSADAYSAQVDKEHRWLPALAPRLPLRIPEPVAKGSPSADFPRPWSIYRWIDGEPAGSARIVDDVDFATDLAGFLTALYAVDASEGPPAGAHSFNRGGSLAAFDVQTRQLIGGLTDEIDATGATAVWDAALAAPWDGRQVWVHGDVTGSNLLVGDGRLSAVIDFGCSAVGDPACDPTMAWTFFTGASRTAFRRGLDLDPATWARARGWALWKALLALVEDKRRVQAADAARRFGWRHSPAEIVDSVIAEHRRSDATR